MLNLQLLLLVPLLTPQTADVDANAEPQLSREILPANAPVVRPGSRIPEGALAAVGDVRLLSLDVPPEGDMPRELCFTPDGNTVVIANRDTSNLTFLDFATQQITHTVAVGEFPVDVAVSADGTKAVSADVLSDSVSIVDVTSHTLLAQVNITGTQPFSVEITPDSQFAVVGVINDALNSSYSVIDLTTLSEVRVIPSASQGVLGFFFTTEGAISGNLFTQWALTPDGARIVLPDRSTDTVFVYDVATGAQLAALATAGAPTSVDVSLDGTTAVVAHENGVGALTVIDLVSLSVSASHLTGQSFQNQVVRITPDKAFAVAAISNNVVFVDLATGLVSATVSTGIAGDIGLTADQSAFVVTNFTTRVIDIASQSVTSALSVAPTADLAMSPVSARAAALNNRFREDVHLYDVSNPGGAALGKVSSGAPPEADAPRPVAITPDGTKAVVGHVLSRSLSVVDVVNESVLATLPTGERCLDAAITADGTTGVVLATDSDRVTIVDLATNSVATELVLPTRPSRVVLSPDSQRAYVTTLAGTDRLWFLNLAGGATSIAGSLITGQMGASYGYSNSEFSGLAISPDGSTIAVCESFDDTLRLVSALGQNTIAQVPVGDFPIRARFSPDGTRCYVLDTFSDDLQGVDVAGVGSTVTGVVTGIDLPSTVDVDPSGAWVYVGSYSSTAGGLYVVDAGGMVLANVLTIGRVRESRLSAAEGKLYLLTEDPTIPTYELVTVDLNGAGSAVSQTVPLDSAGLSLDVATALGKTVVSLPALDAVDVIDTASWSNFCTSTANSAGVSSAISLTGSTSVGANDLVLHATSGLPGGVGIFFYGTTQIEVPFGFGFRCAGGTVLRLNPPQTADGAGDAVRVVDNTVPPASAGPGAFTPGATFHFQYWYRDPAAGAPAFNLSNGLTVTFVP